MAILIILFTMHLFFCYEMGGRDGGGSGDCQRLLQPFSATRQTIPEGSRAAGIRVGGWRRILSPGLPARKI